MMHYTRSGRAENAIGIDELRPRVGGFYFESSAEEKKIVISRDCLCLILVASDVTMIGEEMRDEGLRERVVDLEE